MAKSSGLNFNLPSVDDLFSTEEERAEARLEKVVNLSPAEISDFPNHPFKVRMDEAMREMTESVKQYGVLVPALVRPKPEGGYEMVAGHRRKKAADLAGLAEIPCIVRQLTDDEATIIMVDSNLQREQILPSEKAFAYKMKLDAMKRQQGERTDLTCATPLHKLDTMTNEELNTRLYEKMFAEQEQFRDWLLSQPPAEILNHAYEYTVREDILMSLEYHDLEDSQARALLKSDKPLKQIFERWENQETSYMDTVWDMQTVSAGAVLGIAVH